MRIEYYIGVNNLIGQQHIPDPSTFESIAKRYEYIICQEYQAFSGCFWFNFTVFDSSLKGTRIENNNWTISKICTASSNTAQPVIFTIIDPHGLSNVEADIIRADKPYHDSIIFPGLGTDSLNKGLAFFKQVSKFSSWEGFLNSDMNKEFTTKSPQKDKKMHISNNERLDELEEENQALKNKISQISSILSNQ